jgi:glycosyltransferase involved in cell wall biosynthesis
MTRLRLVPVARLRGRMTDSDEPKTESRKRLHIAWIGFAPAEETGGVPGIATDLLHGLTARGHRIDCFFPARERALPPRITGAENLTVVWGTSDWQWDRWYSRTRLTTFASSLVARSFASFRLRAKLARIHRSDPYDVLYQFSNVENLAVPRRIGRTVPLVAHPGQSSADALRFLIRERGLRSKRRRASGFAVTALVLWLRSRIQRKQIRDARLVVCISDVFREHLVRDYGLQRERSVVVPNPVRLDRFADTDRPCGTPPTIVVLGRIATGKGIEDVVALAKLLLRREYDVAIRIVGGTSVWSDYTKLLDALPSENSEYVGWVHPDQVPDELARADILLQASKYEAFALTVAEALGAGVPVVATSEVGAIERVDRSVAAEIRPGDVEGMAAAVTTMIERLRANPAAMRSLARAEAERLFAPEVVCGEISAALERLAAADDAPVQYG